MQIQKDTHLVFLYGPPAVGKYTIAKALSAQLEWPLFHNHDVIDYVEKLITRENPNFLEACEEVRNALTRRALESGRSFITTFVYGAGVDDAFVERTRLLVEAAGAKFCPVQLICSPETLRARCVAPHRKQMKKIASVETLQSVLAQYDCFKQLPDVHSSKIDTDVFSVVESVAAIRSHFAI